MKNSFSKIFTNFEKKLHIILPVITLICFAGFLGSIIFPNEVLDTNKVNMTESEEDFYIDLQYEDSPVVVFYKMKTEARPLKGIQIGINKNGSTMEGVHLIYKVFVKDPADSSKWLLVSNNTYNIGSQAYDFQYVYLPFLDSEKCQGDILIEFHYEAGSEADKVNPPSIRFNKTYIEDTLTYTLTDSQETIVEGGLMISCIYSHNTYPFLYEFRILSFIFLAVSMTLSYESLNGVTSKLFIRKKEQGSAEGGKVNE